MLRPSDVKHHLRLAASRRACAWQPAPRQGQPLTPAAPLVPRLGQPIKAVPAALQTAVKSAPRALNKETISGSLSSCPSCSTDSSSAATRVDG